MVHAKYGFSNFNPDPWIRAFKPITLPDYWIDKYEVTNRQFKKFVDAGGYQKQGVLEALFSQRRTCRSLGEAMAEFLDATGRPGPSTWEAGDYPKGQDDYPVSGVSWYEAAAYAEFVARVCPPFTIGIIRRLL